MFESIEIRKVKNGVIVTLRTEEDEDAEYVYDTDRKAVKFVKDLLETKTRDQAEAWPFDKNTTSAKLFGSMVSTFAMMFL